MKDWKKEFLKNLDYLLIDDNIPWDKSCTNELIKQVELILLTQRQSFIELVEKMKKEVSLEDREAGDYGSGKVYGYNQAIYDVLAKLRK